jgi:hypothetical protein
MIELEFLIQSTNVLLPRFFINSHFYNMIEKIVVHYDDAVVASHPDAVESAVMVETLVVDN